MMMTKSCDEDLLTPLRNRKKRRCALVERSHSPQHQQQQQQLQTPFCSQPACFHAAVCESSRIPTKKSPIPLSPSTPQRYSLNLQFHPFSNPESHSFFISFSFSYRFSPFTRRCILGDMRFVLEVDLYIKRERESVCVCACTREFVPWSLLCHHVSCLVFLTHTYAIAVFFVHIFLWSVMNLPAILWNFFVGVSIMHW